MEWNAKTEEENYKVISIFNYMVKWQKQPMIHLPFDRSIGKVSLSRYVSGRQHGGVVVNADFSTNLRIEIKCLWLKCANHSGPGACRAPYGSWTNKHLLNPTSNRPATQHKGSRNVCRRGPGLLCSDDSDRKNWNFRWSQQQPTAIFVTQRVKPSMFLLVCVWGFF